MFAAPGLSWAELARRLGRPSPHCETMGPGRARPNVRYMMALTGLAGELGLGHIFTD